MSKSLLNAVQKTINRNGAFTANGAVTNKTSLSPILDFFVLGPVCKSNPGSAIQAFQTAYAHDSELALRTLLWLRDAREGAGARRAFRDCLSWLCNKNPEDAIRVLNRVPELGRWDDLLSAFASKHHDHVIRHAVEMIRAGLKDPETQSLCAKWMPRKGVVAAAVRAYLGLTPKGYRKTIVELTNVPETNMCANDWSGINYSHVPSVAFARNKAAFKRNDEHRFTAFVESAKKGEAKINTGAIYPHDVIRGLTPRNAEEAEAQWSQLPNFIGDNDVLVMADVSGSMETPVSGSVTAMDISIGLATYVAERNTGSYKNRYLTFSESPKVVEINPKNSLYSRLYDVRRTDVGYNTNFIKAFKVLLESAVRENIPQADMPPAIIAISDMEFDAATHYYGNRAEKADYTNLDAIRKMYSDAGYTMPRLIFWNVNGRLGNMPGTKYDRDIYMISGYSPAILKQTLAGSASSSEELMMEVIGKPRYDLG